MPETTTVTEPVEDLGLTAEDLAVLEAADNPKSAASPAAPAAPVVLPESEKFSGVDPDKLPEELKAVYKSLQGDYRICTKCGAEKRLLLDFHRSPRSRAGRSRICKYCTLVYEREYREKNKQSVLDNARRYRSENKESINAYKRAWFRTNPTKSREYGLKQSFGISLQDYDKMLEKQGGGCAICGSRKSQRWEALCVDHCHKTGSIRGLLCVQCNAGIGFFRDNIHVLTRAIEYISVFR